MPSLGSYLLGAVQLLVLGASLALTAHRLRGALLPAWRGAPARLVEAVTALATLTVLAELLGTLHLLYAGTLLLAAVLLAALATWATARAQAPDASPAGAAGESAWSLAVMTAVLAIVTFHWLTITKHALDRGIFNFDSLWYHMPFAAEMAKHHSTTTMVHVETVFTNWFYPQNSELLHAVGILLTGRDTLSLYVNLGWLAIAFLAAYCVGRPYCRGSLTVIAAAVLLECHTLVVRDPGSGKNDLAAVALILTAVAILVEAWNRRHPYAPPGRFQHFGPYRGQNAGNDRGGLEGERWALAAAGLAAGLAAGTRVTALAMAAALSVTVIVLAPPGRRLATAGWWTLPALLGGGYWYLRNLIVAGNPIPEVKRLGPISLPHPERLQEGRPDFTIAHYATDTGVWRHYFAPGLHDAFGALWPVVVAAAAAAALISLLGGRDRIVRAAGAVALFGLLAYLFTPLTAAGAEGEPVAFGINIRYVVPALLVGLVLLPLPRVFDDPRRRWGLAAALVLVLLATDRPDAALHDRARLFAAAGVVLAVGAPAALLLARRRGAGAGAVFAGAAALALALVALGYPLQRHYLEERFQNRVATEAIPGMHLDTAYRWAQGVRDARIGLAGTTAGFAGYGFYGPDLSNDVHYLGQEGPHGAFNAIPTCTAFRAAVNAARLDYLVTAPFLNFLSPDHPIRSPEQRWLRGDPAAEPLLGSGPVTVWRVRGRLEPGGCGQRNAPLRQLPDTPPGSSS